MPMRPARCFISVAGLGLVLGLAAAPQPAAAQALIGSCPFTIALPGTYLVSRDLNCPGVEAAIDITADNVILLLGRRSVTGAGTDEGVGIRARGTSEDPIEKLLIRGGSVEGFFNGLEIANAPGARINQVTVLDNRERGISAESSSGAQLVGNIVRGNTSGLVLQRCDGCLAQGNRAIANAVRDLSDGIQLQRTAGARVEGNVATGNADDGIELRSDSTGNVVRLNVVTGNGRSGIDIADRSTGNRILLNKATGNNVDGLGTDGDLSDVNLRSGRGCVNTWRANRFATDTEGDGPGAGCIR
jgi:parallel beta-helix repeat protein